MPDLTDTNADINGAFVFQTDDTTPQQVVNALEDFTTWLDLFEVRSREYGDGAAFELGSKGQFSDIYRKIIKLRTAIWDGKPEQLTSEGTEEVVYDLIGHLFLTLQCLRLENRKAVINPAYTKSSPIEFRGDTAREALKEIIDGSAAFKRLAGIDERATPYMIENNPSAGDYFDGGIDYEAEAIRKIKQEEYNQQLEVKRQRVLELYPQIGKGSLDARTEESLDWLISAANPDGEDPYPGRGRDYCYGKGDRVRNIGSGGWLSGLEGVIARRDYASAGVWYIVDFDQAGANHITCSEGSLELVSRSKEWWAKQEVAKHIGKPIMGTPVGRKLKDAPQA